jgi:hypothetical protein
MQGPAALSLTQVQVAVKPVLGGEMRVYVTGDQALQLASFTVPSANSGVQDVGSPYAFNCSALTSLINGYPMDLVVVAENLVQDTAPISITVYGKDQNGAAQTGVAIFEPPAYAGVIDNIFEAGWMADVVPTVPTSQWTVYSAFSIACTTAAAGAHFSIWAMPNVTANASGPTNYRLIGATQEKSVTTNSQQPLAISAGLSEGYFIKPGVIPVAGMRVKARWVSLGDGILRFDGASNLTIRVDVQKEQKVIDQRIFFMNAALNSAMTAGELASVGDYDAVIIAAKFGVIVAQQVGSPAE